jgi:ribosomal protein L29
MVKKKLKELRELTNEELLKMRSDTQAAMRTIRFRTKIEKPSNPMEKRNLTKKVAVINTILRERELKS